MSNFKEEWSRAKLQLPRHNIISHERINQKPFIPSFEKDGCPPYMNWLLSWEYGRCWLKERNEFVKKRDTEKKAKHIKPDYKQWLEKHKRKEKVHLCSKAK